MGAATRNEYLISMVAFCNWAVRDCRMLSNPLAGIVKADRSSDRRRQRRAMTIEEVGRLLDAARRRPVPKLGRKSVRLPKEDRVGRNSWTFTPLVAGNFEDCHARGLAKLERDPERLARLNRLGAEQRHARAKAP